MSKINIAELLKDCPKGMELDCTMYDGLEFDSIDESISDGPIKCIIKCPYGGYAIHRFSKYGLYDNTPHSKCVIFPKGKTTWEGFQRPFKDGEVVVYEQLDGKGLQIFIFKCKKENKILSECYLMLDGNVLDLECGMYYVTRLATEEEKQKLFDAIKFAGYKWNAETKTVDKLIDAKFKKGTSLVKWQTGEPNKEGTYIVTYKHDSRVCTSVLYYNEFVWLTIGDCNRMPKERIIAWCKLSDVKPFVLT